MGPYRADHLVLREEPELQTETKKQKTKLGISDTGFPEEKFYNHRAVNQGFLQLLDLVDKRADTPESISDPAREDGRHFPSFFWRLTINIVTLIISQVFVL